MKDIIIINFKTYENATGKKALKLAKICEKVALKNKANIIVAVQPTDIKEISNSVKIPVIAQHIDVVNYGSNTGFILPEAVKQSGAKGTLINHSEHQIKNIKETIEIAKKLKLKTYVCANTVKKGVEIAKYNPDFIAIEPPELIGGKISVSTAKPSLIKNSVEKINCKVLVGAGINSHQDLVIARKFGAKGILLASAITKAKNPEKVLTALIKGQ